MIECCWSRVPGKFVDKTTGKVASGCTFTGTTREWYETLVEVIIDVAVSVEKIRTDVDLRSVRLYAHPDVVCILQASVLYGSPVCDKKLVLDPIAKSDVRRDKIEFINEETGEIVGTVTVLDIKDDGFLAHLFRLLGL